MDGALAGFAVYRLAPGRITFVHTEIDDAYAGQGLGGQLARAALDDVRGRGLAVRPDCPFIRAGSRSTPTTPTWWPDRPVATLNHRRRGTRDSPS